MINLIKMDIYRLFRTKALYIIAVTFFIFVFLFTYMQFELFSTDSSITISVENIMELTMILFTLVITIFSTLFTTSENTSGYIKNIGGQISARSLLIVSKAAALLLYTIIMFGAYLIVQLIAYRIVCGDITFQSEPKDFAIYVAIEILLHFALALVCIMIALVIPSSGIAMTLSVILGCRITTNFYAAINMLFDSIKDFDVSNYLLIGNIGSLSAASTNHEAMTAILVGIIFGAASMLISCLIFEKKDIV